MWGVSMLTKDRVLFEFMGMDEDYADIEVLYIQGPDCSEQTPTPSITFEIDAIGFDEVLRSTCGLPEKPGMYVWEGNCIYSGPDWDGEWDCEVDGEIRPSTAVDEENFEAWAIANNIRMRELYPDEQLQILPSPGAAFSTDVLPS